MKIILPLLLCFYLESEVKSRVWHALKRHKNMPLLQLPYKYVKREVAAEYSYSDHSQINEPYEPDADPQKGEFKWEENLENDQIQRFKRQIKPDMKAQFEWLDSFFASEEDEESDELETDDSNSMYQKAMTIEKLPTEFCIRSDKHRNRVYKHGRNFQSDGIIIARNPFHQACAIGKRNKRRIEPRSVSEYQSNSCMEPSSISEPKSFIGLEPSSVFDHKFSSGDDQESYFAEYYNPPMEYEFEQKSEIFADEYVAYENFLRNAGLNRQYG